MPVDVEAEALRTAGPSRTKQSITSLLKTPFIFPLWLTLPDTRTARGKKFFIVTFIGCIIWIAVYSSLIAWWTIIVDETVLIESEVSYN